MKSTTRKNDTLAASEDCRGIQNPFGKTRGKEQTIRPNPWSWCYLVLEIIKKYIRNNTEKFECVYKTILFIQWI